MAAAAATIAYNLELYPKLLVNYTDDHFRFAMHDKFILITLPNKYRMRINPDYDMSLIATYCESIMNIKLPNYLIDSHGEWFNLTFYKNAIGYVTETHFDEFTKHVDSQDYIMHASVEDFMQDFMQDFYHLEYDINDAATLEEYGRLNNVPDDALYEAYAAHTRQSRETFTERLLLRFAEKQFTSSDIFTTIGDLTRVDTKPARLIPHV